MLYKLLHFSDLSINNVHFLHRVFCKALIQVNLGKSLFFFALQHNPICLRIQDVNTATCYLEKLELELELKFCMVPPRHSLLLRKEWQNGYKHLRGSKLLLFWCTSFCSEWCPPSQMSEDVFS